MAGPDDEHLEDEADEDVLFASILVRDQARPDLDAIVEAARDLGVTLSNPRSGLRGRHATWELKFETARGASVEVWVDRFGDPLRAIALPGVNSPPRETLAAAAGTVHVSASGLTGSARERDTELARLAAAVARCTSAISVQLRHQTHHEASLFTTMVAFTRDGSALPPEIAVEVTTWTHEDEEGRLGLLTENMERYGREEIYVTCLQHQSRDARILIQTLARWLLTDLEKELPSGDTVGRTPEERLIVQRVPNPTGEGPDVIRVDL